MTGHKIINRYKESGFEGLNHRSRKPFRNANRLPFQAAAIAIARRGLGFSESPTKRMVFVPTRNGSHVTFPLPARNHRKHVWSHWSDIRKSLIAAQKAHTRSGNLPAPLSSMKNLSSANCVSGMQMPRVSQGLLLPDVDQMIPF